MAYRVTIRSTAERRLERMPDKVRKLFYLLAEDLRADGPIQASWPNYSRLGQDRYHCHLTRRHVACWRCAKHSTEVEVYYVGSREDAPY